MKILKKIYHTYFAKFPNPSTIDKSGIICSDHPVVGNGWIKGWVVGDDKIIVCKHSYPSKYPPNNKVYVIDKWGKKITREVSYTISYNFFNYDDALDICVCKLNEPFPESVKRYKIAEKISDYQKTILFDQNGEISEATIRINSDGTIKGVGRKNQLDAGDSGTPWFVWEKKEWRVATHTFRGQYGIGPWYGDKKIITELKSRIKDG